MRDELTGAQKILINIIEKTDGVEHKPINRCDLKNVLSYHHQLYKSVDATDYEKIQHLVAEDPTYHRTPTHAKHIIANGLHEMIKHNHPYLKIKGLIAEDTDINQKLTSLVKRRGK